MHKLGLSAVLVCVAVGISGCSSTLPALDITVPKASVETTSVAELFPGKTFDHLIVACPETTSADLETLLEKPWSEAQSALPKNDGQQGLILTSGGSVVAAGVNDRTSVDLCLRSVNGPFQITSGSSLKGTVENGSWTVAWPKL